MNKVLYLYIHFYTYHKNIESEIKNNFDIISYSINPKFNYFERVINKLFPCYYKYKTLKWQKKLISKLKRSSINFDNIFVLVGRGLKTWTLQQLKSMYPNAKFILYLWDDISRVENALEKLKYFDIIYSSDSNDVKKYGFTFLPLFYCNEFYNNGDFEKKNRLFLCGNLHSERLSLMKKVYEFTTNNDIESDLMLSCSPLNYIKTYCSIRNTEIFNYIGIKYISLKECAKRTKQAKTVVDMPYASQAGLSIRTFEALAAQCKIITTNKHIKEYDFYCPENVMIIDRENPVFDVDFIKSPYKPLPKGIIEKYSLENWIKTIFDDK